MENSESTKRVRKSLTPLEGSRSQSGSKKSESGTSKLMKTLGIKMNRENYINTAFLGTPPEERIGPELEAEFPEEVRKKAFEKPTKT